jgi:molybdopterin synthase catalytic subunit/molybdopterin converting factor small subunit
VRVQVRLFAMQRAQVGRARVDLELPRGATVADAWHALVADFPELAPGAASVRFAHNGRYADAATALGPGDELAVIPPVAGGAPTPPTPPTASDDRRRHLAIAEAPIDDGLLGDLRARLATPADGAVVTFVGQTRETPGTPAPGQEAQAARFAGQRVTGLAYEAFEPMALAILEDIADEIEARYGVRRLAIVHRVGDVGLGEASVAIAVAAAHRQQAFEACRYAIEELKARAPIWKAERFAGGDVWLGAPARDGPPPDAQPPER